jgi:hypothetical protein
MQRTIKVEISTFIKPEISGFMEFRTFLSKRLFVIFGEKSLTLKRVNETNLQKIEL